MASAESKHVRDTLVKDLPSNTPLSVQRKEWEDAAVQAEMLPNTVTEAITAEGIPCLWVRDAAANQNKVFLFVHGGGFNSGSDKTHRELASRLSNATAIPVLLPDYRLAPENPYPFGLNDVVRVYRWLLSQGWLPQDIIIGGDSAGANLAVSALLSLRDNGDTLPLTAILLSPWLDLTLSGETMTTNAAIDPTTTRESLHAAAQYYAVGKDTSLPLISPVFAELHGLPPMLIQVGGDEILLSDSTRFADKAKAAGVDVQLDVWQGMWHTWHGWASTLPEAREAIEALGQYAKLKLEPS